MAVNDMIDTYISFYLKNNRIHIFTEALRSIGSPKYVCFMLAENGDSFVLAPYEMKNFHSHRVSPSVYSGKSNLELTSICLCKIFTTEFGWDCSKSYRIPGRVNKQHGVVIFNLREASIIEK